MAYEGMDPEEYRRELLAQGASEREAEEAAQQLHDAQQEAER